MIPYFTGYPLHPDVEAAIDAYFKDGYPPWLSLTPEMREFLLALSRIPNPHPVIDRLQSLLARPSTWDEDED